MPMVFLSAEVTDQPAADLNPFAACSTIKVWNCSSRFTRSSANFNACPPCSLVTSSAMSFNVRVAFRKSIALM